MKDSMKFKGGLCLQETHEDSTRYLIYNLGLKETHEYSAKTHEYSMDKVMFLLKLLQTS